jgi:hypothetical protein
MGIAAAVAGAAVVGAGASIYSSSKASKTAKNTAAANNALQSQIYGENKATLAPYVAAGNAATPAIQGLLGIGGNAGASAKAFQNWQNSTGYQFQLKQGQDSVTAALGAKGLTDSGAALKALTQYGQNAAQGSFQTYLGDLTQQQGVGLSAASAQAGVGQNYANAVSNNNNTAANASENASLSMGSSINSALGNAVSAYSFNQALGSGYGSGGVLSGGGNYGLGGIY